MHNSVAQLIHALQGLLHFSHKAESCIQWSTSFFLPLKEKEKYCDSADWNIFGLADNKQPVLLAFSSAVFWEVKRLG